MADDVGDAITAERDMGGSEDGFKTTVTELPDGEKGTVAERRKDMGLASGEGQLRKREEGSVGGLDVFAVGHEDTDAMGSGFEVHAGTVEAEKVGGAP